MCALTRLSGGRQGEGRGGPVTELGSRMEGGVVQAYVG